MAACASNKPSADAPAIVHSARHVDVELPQFEIHADGYDRFATCPPSGGVTQGWIPKIPPWTPSKVAISADAGAPITPITPTAAAIVQDRDREIAVTPPKAGEPTNAPSPAEKAIRDTLQPFRNCHHRGLLHDKTQDGHVAIVVRVAADGRVAEAESYGACELSREVVRCMAQVGKRLRFDPPAEGRASIIIPAVFAPRSGIVRQAPGQNDDYAAAAAVALEAARPGLHDCEKRERREVRSQDAWGTFVLEVGAKGEVRRQNIEPWSGNQELLRCASDVLSRAALPVPPDSSATVRVRIAFNPRGILGSE